MEVDAASRLIARLVASRYLRREDDEIKRLLIDPSLREEVERRLASCGLRLLDHPFADHVAIALAKEAEAVVFNSGDAWQSSNVGLPKDAAALLVLLWALIILPKRERQYSRSADSGQTEMFELARTSIDARGIAENVLIEDYGKLMGGKTRIGFNLPMLKRLGFIERSNGIIHEGPLLDLAFDYAELAPRILQGALADLLRDRATPKAE